MKHWALIICNGLVNFLISNNIKKWIIKLQQNNSKVILRNISGWSWKLISFLHPSIHQNCFFSQRLKLLHLKIVQRMTQQNKIKVENSSWETFAPRVWFTLETICSCIQFSPPLPPPIPSPVFGAENGWFLDSFRKFLCVSFYCVRNSQPFLTHGMKIKVCVRGSVWEENYQMKGE